MDFVAVDVETANSDLASICQVGLAVFRSGEVTDELRVYVDPEDYFDALNVAIHGIDEGAVAGAPTFPAVAANLASFLEGRVVLSHTPFDRIAFRRACLRYGLAQPTCRWLDSARVARRAWPQCAKSGYGLADVCELLGHELVHHDALEDAKAAGHILMAAVQVTGLAVDQWFVRVEQPIDPATDGPIVRTGSSEGPFFGESLVFTGALAIPRREAADLASSLGFDVTSGVTKKTTVVVVGDQDLRRLEGHEKSAKHRKAEALMSRGQSLRILQESDFQQLAVTLERLPS